MDGESFVSSAEISTPSIFVPHPKQGRCPIHGMLIRNQHLFLDTASARLGQVESTLASARLGQAESTLYMDPKSSRDADQQAEQA